MVNVTQTYLPPLEDYIGYLQGIWERGHVTNNGPLVRELEEKLKIYLGVKHLFFVSNGTIALQIAIKALSLQGEIITTPFSYVATTSSIVWEGCQPVFADIDPETLNIDPEQIEHNITAKTTAILATHVYGYPCDVFRIQKIASDHGLKVIYDAAHAFGVKYQGKSILNYGDISTLSFHATKLFHTIEGGAIVTDDDQLARKIAYMRNFGHKGTEEFWGLGINGKNSEFHAAMGLCILPKVPEIISRRKIISEFYDNTLATHGIKRPAFPATLQYNFGYYPIVLSSEDKLTFLMGSMNARQIFPRRYFYPALNTLPYLPETKMPVSENIASRVLCLPFYEGLEKESQKVICDIINSHI